MTTSPSPISAADRERLGTLKQRYNNALANRQHAGGAWSDYQSAVMEKADAYEARVVELEAIVAAQERGIVDLGRQAAAQYREQEARATALLEALRDIRDWINLPGDESPPAHRMAARARAAINAGASNERK